MYRISPEFQEVINNTIRLGLCNNVELTSDYIDQSMYRGGCVFVAHTPFGIANIEEAFRTRMKLPYLWDSKDQIRFDIIHIPHLHANIKNRLLREFDENDWARWYDGFYADYIMLGCFDYDKLKYDIEINEYLTCRSRENLLFNLMERNGISQ